MEKDDNTEFYNLNDIKPKVLLKEDTYKRLYLDIDDLKKKLSIPLEDIELSLVTKHNTYPRGIQPGYHGRNNSKHKKGDLIQISNVYLGNPYKGTYTKKVYTDYLFNKVYVDPDDGEIYFMDKDNHRHNFYEYLQTKKISKADYGKKSRVKHKHLYYGFVIKYKSNVSSYDLSLDALYDSNRELQNLTLVN